METAVAQKIMAELVAHQEVLRAFVGAALSCFPDDIDDVVQNANLAVIRRLDAYDPSRPLLPWLIAFAKNQILAFRTKRRADRLVFDEEALDRLAETYGACDTPGLPVMTRLAICKRKLDEETQKMLEERYGDDRKPRELAKLHNTTSREIRNRLTYARRKLAECIMRLCRISESSFERDYGDSTELEEALSLALDEQQGPSARQKLVALAAQSPEKMREYGELTLVDTLLRSQFAARRAEARAAVAAAPAADGVPSASSSHPWLRAAGWGLAFAGFAAIAATTGYIYHANSTSKGDDMNSTLKTTLVAAASLAQSLSASADVTKTWVGDGSDAGTWQTESCWNPSGIPSSSDAVVIDSGSCEYVAGGDLTIAADGSLTLNGGKFFQTGGVAWMQISGAITVGSGATFDMGTAGQMNVNSGASVTIKSNGTFKASALNLSDGSTFTVSGTLAFANQTTLALNDGFTLDGGSILNVNELQWSADREIAGSVSAVKLAAQAAGKVLTVGDGTITLSAALADCVWQSDTSYVNVKKGATTEFVFTQTEAATENVYSVLFAGTNPKIRYGGETFADEAAFLERFEVTGETGNVHVKAIALPDDSMIFAGDATVAQGEGNNLKFSVKVQKPGIPVGALYLAYGTSNVVSSLTGWDHVVPVADAAEAEKAYEQTLEVTPNTVIYYVFALSNETDVVYSGTSPKAMVAGASANLFLGTASSDAGDAANWSRGRVPAATDTVVFMRDVASNDMTWPATLTSVGGWLQPASDKTGYVTFALTTSAPLEVAGDVLLEHGVWTHTGAAEGVEPTTAVAVKIGGKLTVASDAQITAGSGELNVTEKKTRGWYHGGPGYKAGTGASYGGEGSTNDVVYGSILNPMEYGSSGQGDSDSYAGGGLVWLTVGGRAQIEGEISSRGYAWTGQNGGSSGGTVNLTCRSLDGAGVISADAGKLSALTFDETHGSGSGGRVAVRLTGEQAGLDYFTGTMPAYGNRGKNAEGDVAAVPCSAAGTVFVATGADNAAGSGEIIVANGALMNEARPTEPGPRTQATVLPGTGPRCDSVSRLKRMRLTVKEYGRAKLSASFRVAAVTLDGADAVLDLNGQTLSTSSLVVNGVTFKRGTYTAAQIAEKLDAAGVATTSVTGDGSVIVGGNRGFQIIIR